jgi:hypothetical protein
MMIQQQFDNLELKQSINHKGTSRRKYHPKVFRTWATNFLKDHTYPADWAEIEAGHKLGVPDHYKPTLEQRAKKWQELIEPHMHFLTPTPPTKGSDKDTITELKTELRLQKDQIQHIQNALAERTSDLLIQTVNQLLDKATPEQRFQFSQKMIATLGAEQNYSQIIQWTNQPQPKTAHTQQRREISQPSTPLKSTS